MSTRTLCTVVSPEQNESPTSPGPGREVLMGLGALCLLLAACTSQAPTDDSDDDSDDDVVVPAAPMVGVHHIVNQWDEQALVDELDPGFLRINFQHVRTTKALATGNWTTIDGLVQANAQHRLLATVYPRNNQGHVDADAFLELSAVLAERYGDAIEYWQLDNEPAFSATRWPEGFDPYAELLGGFAEAVRSKDPDADIVLGGLAGFSYADLSSLERELLVAVASHPEAATVDVIDLHHHRFWREGSTTRQQLAATRAFIDDAAPGLGHARYLFTENTTYAGAPASFPAQDPRQQAAFVLTSVLAALSSGAEACAFGVMMDRPQWAGDPSPHPFNLNGLYYNPHKGYGDEQNLSGPKPAAHAHAVLRVLTQDLGPDDLRWVEHADGAFAVDLGARATVIWAEQAKTHALEREGMVLTLDDIEIVDIATMSLDTLREFGTQRSSVELFAHEPVVVLWE